MSSFEATAVVSGLALERHDSERHDTAGAGPITAKVAVAEACGLRQAATRLWSGRWSSGRNLACLFGASVLALGLAGCEAGSGFRPLYGTLGSSGPGVAQKMAQIEIATIPGRNGQRVRNELIFQTTGGGEAVPPAYRLDITMRETSTTTLVNQAGNSAGQIWQIEAKFQLIRLSDKKVVLEGLSQARATYERFPTIYSNVRANEDAGERASKTIATDLKSRLAAFLSQSS